VALFGVLQPFLDGVKLLKKEAFSPFGVSFSVFRIIPLSSFLILYLE